MVVTAAVKSTRIIVRGMIQDFDFGTIRGVSTDVFGVFGVSTTGAPFG